MTIEKAMEIIATQAEKIYDLEKENENGKLWFECYTERTKEVNELEKEIERLQTYFNMNIEKNELVKEGVL